MIKITFQCNHYNLNSKYKMQINEQNRIQNDEKPAELSQDVYSFPLPVRIKHPSWSVRKGTYEQILYLLQTLSHPNEQILISGNSYTIQTLLPYFQNLIQQKHTGVLLKGLQCVEQILKLDRKISSKHCIKILADKGIQYFPLLSQQRKAILQKFLDILEMCKIDGNFLKNKLTLPHQKSVMYVIEVIGVLNIASLKSTLLSLSKKHQKKCVRELAVEIAQQLNDGEIQKTQEDQQDGSSNAVQRVIKKQTKQNPSNLTCKITIQKFPHYEQMNSKKKEQFSTQILQKIHTITQDYSLSQLPNFSHILRLMIDDNNHIININAIKCLISIFQKEKEDVSGKNSLIPISFPLLFIFNKFKSHKTHPINALLLSLIETIVQLQNNRVNDLFLAINQGLNSSGSKANVKFGCALSFFRIIALIHECFDLYNCTTNENIEIQNQNLQQKFTVFKKFTLSKNVNKLIEKILASLEKDKKYQTEIYLIRHAIGMQIGETGKIGLEQDHKLKSNKSNVLTVSKAELKTNKPHVKAIESDKVKKQSLMMSLGNKKAHDLHPSSKEKIVPNSLSKTLKNSQSHNKFQQINIEQTLNQIIKQLNKHNEYQQQKPYFHIINNLIQRSCEQFYQCVHQKRFEMFYLCQLLHSFIDKYEPNDLTISTVSQFLINVLKIISLLKPMNLPNEKSSSALIKQFKQISLHNVSELLLVSLCKLVVSEDIQQVLQNLSQNYTLEILLQSFYNLFLYDEKNKIKKKNRKYLMDWLESNTSAIYLNDEYYKLVERLTEKIQKTKHPESESLLSLQHHHKLHHPQYFEHESKISQTQKNLQLSSPNRRQAPVIQELQNINLSKIEEKGGQSNFYEEDFDKSSFHRNLQEHLKQINTQRSACEDNNIDSKLQEKDYSRQYLNHLQKNQAQKGNDEQKNRYNHMISKSTPLKQSPDSIEKQICDDNENEQIQAGSNERYDHSLSYEEKLNELQHRRKQKQKERKQFMNRMKYEYKPMISKNQYSEEESENNQEIYEPNNPQEEMLTNSKSSILHNLETKNPSPLTNNKVLHTEYEYSNDLIIKNERENNRASVQQNLEASQKIIIEPQSILREQYFKLSPSNLNESKNITEHKTERITEAIDSSFASNCEESEFKYRMINAEKVTHFIKTTTNPFPHLRAHILIPFKSSSKKQQFLKELIHFFSNKVQFKIPQPFNSIVLLTILLFTEIKEDKSLIQPLQSLYEFVAKQSTTNEFIKSIITLFHSVIQETLPQNRKFLITILLKSMIRMLPFIEDGLQLLRDLQQFYQIGQMVYFQMFEQEYVQIKNYIQEQGVHVVVEKALEQQGDNLSAIVQGWIATAFKRKVQEAIQDFKHYNEHSNQNQNQHSYQQQSEHHNEQQNKATFQSDI